MKALPVLVMVMATVGAVTWLVVAVRDGNPIAATIACVMSIGAVAAWRRVRGGAR